MRLVQTDNLEFLRKKYIEVIEQTPDFMRNVRWIYGQHPKDEMIQDYMDNGEMYALMNGNEISGMVAVVMHQDDNYKTVPWQVDLRNDEVATIHILAICPEYQGRSLGIQLINQIEKLSKNNGKKAVRLDVLKSNIPAQKMYERAGYSLRGEQKLYAENTGITDFLFYEKIF